MHEFLFILTKARQPLNIVTWSVPQGNLFHFQTASTVRKFFVRQNSTSALWSLVQYAWCFLTLRSFHYLKTTIMSSLFQTKCHEIVTYSQPSIKGYNHFKSLRQDLGPYGFEKSSLGVQAESPHSPTSAIYSQPPALPVLSKQVYCDLFLTKETTRMPRGHIRTSYIPSNFINVVMDPSWY